MTTVIARTVEPRGERNTIALADVIASVPGARLATPDDNARILAFFDRTPMQTSSFALQYRRSPDFFTLLRYQSPRSYVIMTENRRGDVTGLGTISPRAAWVDGRPTTVAYLGDLRIGLDRNPVRHWRRLFGGIIAHAAEIEELAGCTHWLTTIMDDNALARRVLASGRGGAPACVPVAPFTMRNIVARLPFARARDLQSPWRVRWAEPGDMDRLAAFIETENRALQFGFRGELARRLASWHGLAASSFVIATRGDAIVACAAPWSASRAKHMLVSRLPMSMRALERASALIPGGRLRVPRTGEPLRVGYLTHLTFAAGLTDADRLMVFRVMLDRVFDRWPSHDWHCLALADFIEWNLGRALGGYVQQAVPITIYEVLPPGSLSATRARSTGQPPAFEMATV